MRRVVFINDVLWRHYVGSLWSKIHDKPEISVFGIHLAETHSGIANFGELDRNIHQYPHQTLFHGSLSQVSWLRRTSSLLKVLHKTPFDTLWIYGYNAPAYWFAMLYARFRGKRLLVFSTSNTIDFHRVWYKEFFKRCLLRLPNSLVCCGTSSRKYLETLVRATKIRYAPYVVDDVLVQKAFENQIPKPGYLPENCLIFSGRFTPKKNLFRLIEAFIACKSDWGLILLGDGNEKSAIQDFIENQKIQNVYLFDSVHWQEVPRYYTWAKALTLPSVSEPWGLVINEALHVGLPVLVSENCGATPDLIQKGINGHHFDPNNIVEMQAVLQKFFDNPLKKQPPQIMQRHQIGEAVEIYCSLLKE